MPEIKTVVEDKRLRLLKLELEPFGTNAYIAVCRETGDSALVDAPGEAEAVAAELAGTNPCAILITHGHADHILALDQLREKLNLPVAAHEAESHKLALRPDRILLGGEIIKCGQLALEVLHTPGHTAGSLCFKVDDYLLAGDTIFPGGPGKTASPAAFAQIIRSITGQIFTLPGDTAIFPGHGSSTTVGRERELYEQFTSRPLDKNLYGEITWLSREWGP